MSLSRKKLSGARSSRGISSPAVCFQIAEYRLAKSIIHIVTCIIERRLQQAQVLLAQKRSHRTISRPFDAPSNMQSSKDMTQSALPRVRASSYGMAWIALTCTRREQGNRPHLGRASALPSTGRHCGRRSFSTPPSVKVRLSSAHCKFAGSK